MTFKRIRVFLKIATLPFFVSGCAFIDNHVGNSKNGSFLHSCSFEEKSSTSDEHSLVNSSIVSSLSNIDSQSLESETDLADYPSNMETVFLNVDNNCMVSKKVQDYIDAMKRQEKTLDKPFHFSPLYGPDDYAKNASGPDLGDGVSYDELEKGGVDVCDMLNKNDYNGTAKNYPIRLNWDNNGNTFKSAVLKVWPFRNKENMREFPVEKNGTSVSLDNLFRATRYRVQLVTDDGKISQPAEFETADYPRTITLAGIRNVRDIGGYMTSYGVRTNQGLLYRGYYIDDKEGGIIGKNYTEDIEIVHQEVLKIGFELDLQKDSEANGRSTSCFSGAEYKRLTITPYDSFLKQDSYKNLPDIMKIIANASQKHVYFHCTGGSDRTGTLAFFINAICGVSYTDLIGDFEITTETNNKRCHMHNSINAHFPKFLNEFINKWKDFDIAKTVNENCEKWLIDVAGVAKEDIEGIREAMLPGYLNGNLKPNIPAFTPDGNWRTDNLAHWMVANEDKNVKCDWGRHCGIPCKICGYL